MLAFFESPPALTSIGPSESVCSAVPRLVQTSNMPHLPENPTLTRETYARLIWNSSCRKLCFFHRGHSVPVLRFLSDQTKALGKKVDAGLDDCELQSNPCWLMLSQEALYLSVCASAESLLVLESYNNSLDLQLPRSQRYVQCFRWAAYAASRWLPMGL